MILKDKYMVDGKTQVMDEEQLKRRKEMNIEIAQKTKNLKKIREKINDIEHQSVLDSIKNDYWKKDKISEVIWWL